MTDTVFITGATGFLGTSVLKALSGANARRVQVLVRTPGRGLEGVEEVVGDLLAPETWIGQVDPKATLVHLAALTGKASRRDHFRVNAQASADLFRAAKARGLPRVLLLSSIAVAFADRPGYPYAEAKELAEQSLRSAGLDYLILRPTMIFGAGSAVEAGLKKLAQMPLMPLFGGGQNLVQPIAVDALADFVVRALNEPFCNRTLSLAGPETKTMAAWLQDLATAEGGKARPALKLPLAPIRGLLRLMEPVLLPLMPLTAGQLASFANDVAIVPGRRNHLSWPEAAPPLPEAAAPRDRYAAEAQAIARRLGYAGDLGDVVCNYQDFVAAEPVPESAQRRLGIYWLGRDGLRAAMASVFAARFDRAGPLRRREAFILAQLECLPRSMASVDRCQNRGPVSAWLRFIGWGLAEVGLLLLALPRLGLASRRGRRS